MRNLKVKGNREIAFLAITLSKPDERLGEKAHIEVHAAAYSRAIGYPISVAVDRTLRKLEDKYIVEEVTKRLREHYRRNLIDGLKDDEYICKIARILEEISDKGWIRVCLRL